MDNRDVLGVKKMNDMNRAEEGVASCRREGERERRIGSGL